MAGIRTALANLVAMQETVSITDPITATITKAYKNPPDRQVAPKAPFIINTWSFPEQRDQISQEVHDYSINMQVFCYDASLEQAGDVAAAFHEAILNAWRADPKLTQNGSPGIQRGWLKGNFPTLVGLELNGLHYVGLDLVLDCLIERT